MLINNLPRAALDSGEARIRTRDSVVISRLECTRVHFVQVLVSRPEDPGLGLGLKTASLVPTPIAQLP